MFPISVSRRVFLSNKEVEFSTSIVESTVLAVYGTDIYPACRTHLIFKVLLKITFSHRFFVILLLLVKTECHMTLDFEGPWHMALYVAQEGSP